MSIAVIYQKCKQSAVVYWHMLITIPSRIPRDGIVVLLFVLTTLAGFGFGFVAGENHTSGGRNIWIEQQASTSASSATKQSVATNKVKTVTDAVHMNSHTNSGRAVVASKNGSKYYLASCSGAKRIHNENKIWFTSATAALAKGYTPAQRCTGL